MTDQQILLHAESSLDDECLRTASTLCQDRTLIVCLSTQPPKPIQPTVCVDIYHVIITPNGLQQTPQFVLEIDVPVSGGFSLKYESYVISLVDGVLSIKY
jgi:hypothetical protein